MKHAIWIFALGVFLAAPGTISAGDDETCSCSAVLDELRREVEVNYIGLALMRARGESAAYARHLRHFRRRAETVAVERCIAVLQDFLSFFEDRHLFAFENPEYSQAELRGFRARLKSQALPVGTIIDELERQQHDDDLILGRWYDGKSEIAVVREGHEYRAYLLRTVEGDNAPGDLKAVFSLDTGAWRGVYYAYSGAPRFIEGNVYRQGELLVWTGGLYWQRRTSDESHALAEPVAQPRIEPLDDETLLLDIPSFLVDGRQLTEALLENIDRFRTSRFLIIDVRGNIGGNALYFSFLDAIADRSLPGGQGLVLPSETTLDYFRRAAESAPEVYEPVVQRIIDSPGQIVDGPAYPEREFTEFGSAIEHVAMLTDNGTMSAAEAMILHAKQVSDRVTTFGSPTGGVIDYTSAHTIQLECHRRNIYFGYPTSTLHKNIPDDGHNETGLMPDVPIPGHVKDPIGRIREYFERETG